MSKVQDLFKVPFDTALRAMKKGARCTTSAMYEKGESIFLVEKMSSERISSIENLHLKKYLSSTDGLCSTVKSHFVKICENGSLTLGWTPSAEDCLSIDWMVLPN